VRRSDAACFGLTVAPTSEYRITIGKRHETEIQCGFSDSGPRQLNEFMSTIRADHSLTESPKSFLTRGNRRRFLRLWHSAAAACGICIVYISGLAAHAPQRGSENPGFVQELAAPLSDVQQALDDLLQDETIHGTNIFDKERMLTGAKVVPQTPLFERWKGPGSAYYKIRTEAIAPRHFLDSADQGTVAVRYIVTSVDENRTRLRIDAIFVETSHRTVHPSDGTVESSEFKVFQERLQTIQFSEQEALDVKRRRDSIDLARRTLALQHEDESTRLSAAESSNQDLEQRIHSLRQQIQRRVKAPGADLKSAPFHSAANVMSLSAYTDVVIVIVTPRWYGVETPDGQRGWLPVNRLEALP
jgi:hypothetical protein